MVTIRLTVACSRLRFTHAKIFPGSEVRVKMGAATPLDIPMDGWRGKVYQVSGTMCLVHWTNDTLAALDPSHRERWQRDGVDYRAMWLQDSILEPG